MADAPAPPPPEARMGRAVGTRESRKLRAQRHPGRNVWFGLGMFGLIGWSVVLPALAGVALGAWLDRHYAHSFSWTLSLLFLGLGLGCWNAWHWVSRERRQIHEEGNDGP